MDVLRYLLLNAPPTIQTVDAVHSIRMHAAADLTVEELPQRSIHGPRPSIFFAEGMSRAVFEAYRLFSGPRNLAAAIGRSPSSVYRWGYSSPRFPGGRVPSSCYDAILIAGERYGVSEAAKAVVELAMSEQPARRPVGRPRLKSRVFDEVKMPVGRPKMSFEERKARDSANADERLHKRMRKAGY